MSEMKNSDFPCPCGEMRRNECFGECAKPGRCVVCGAKELGAVNAISFCEAHMDDVIRRVVSPAKILLDQLLGKGG